MTATAKTPSRTAAFLAKAIEFSGMSQRDIAEEAGFPMPNVISMMKQGKTKVPLDRIPGLAAACHVDPVYFLRLALEEYHPEVYAVLVNTLGVPMTENEHELILIYRLVAPNNEIEIRPDVATVIIDTLLEYREDGKGP